MKDEQELVQKRTFAKWINVYLSRADGLMVHDLFVDLRDGTLLLVLLEQLTNKKFVIFPELFAFKFV